MNIHEYQSKQIMREYGIHVPEGYPAFTVEDALENAQQNVQMAARNIAAVIKMGQGMSR